MPCILSAGFIQTPGWNPDLVSTTYPRSMFSFIDIDVPVKHTLMVSVVHMDVEGVSYTCQSDWLMLLEKTDEASLRRVWLGCNSYSQGSAIPVLLHTHMARVVFRSDATVQYYGFRLLYTFHRVGSIKAGLNYIGLRLGSKQALVVTDPRTDQYCGLQLLYTFHQVGSIKAGLNYVRLGSKHQ